MARVATGRSGRVASLEGPAAVDGEGLRGLEGALAVDECRHEARRLFGRPPLPPPPEVHPPNPQVIKATQFDRLIHDYRNAA
jgi:hypothetical protein